MIQQKSFALEIFIRTLKNKIYKYKYKTSISKNVYIDKLGNIVDKYWHVLTLMKKIKIKILNFKLLIF